MAGNQCSGDFCKDRVVKVVRLLRKNCEPSGDKSHGGGGGRAKWVLDGDGGTDMSLVLLLCVGCSIPCIHV